MKKLVFAAVLGGAMAFGMGGAALADSPQTLGNNPNTQAAHSGNCIAVYSSRVTHNGSVVSDQENRGQLVQALQDTCGAHQP